MCQAQSQKLHLQRLKLVTFIAAHFLTPLLIQVFCTGNSRRSDVASGDGEGDNLNDTESDEDKGRSNKGKGEGAQAEESLTTTTSVPLKKG